MKKLLSTVLVVLFALTATFGQPDQEKKKPAKQQTEKPAASKKETVTKKDGTPDKRYKENKKLKKDGTPDKRYRKTKKRPVRNKIFICV